MVVKKSKSVALDSRDLNPLFSLMKGYGPLMALGVIAVLSVCAAFLIYRSSKGQSKRNGEKTVTETEEEEKTNPIPKKRRVENQTVKSTGAVDDSEIPSSEDQDQSEEAPCLDHSHNMETSGLRHRHESVTDYSTLQNGSCASPTGPDGPADQPEVETAPERSEMEVGSDEDLTGGQSGKEDLPGFVTERRMHTFVDDPWEDLSGCFGKAGLKVGQNDLHESGLSHSSPAQNTSSVADSAYEDGESEAEKSVSARDQSVSSTNTDGDFTYYQQSGQDSPTELPDRAGILGSRGKGEVVTWAVDAVDATGKSPEDATVHRCKQETPLVHLYKPDYLSFSPVAFTGMIGGSEVTKAAEVTPRVSAQAQSGGDDVPAEDKTEINIMEATMDNNEWLTGNEGGGGGGGGDFPWLSQSDGGESSSMAEESQRDAEWDTEKSEASEELSAAYASSDNDDDPAARRVATVPPMLQTAHVTFSVHYITDAPSQLLAVTGSQRELGGWQSFVPLHRGKSGFWANTVALPANSRLEWKFVLVEDGEICRWEECSNRHLALSGREEDLYVLGWWGCP